MYLFLAFLFYGVSCDVTSEVHAIVFDAMVRIENVSTMTFVDGDAGMMTSQKANDDSKMLQMKGAILENTTRVLVEKYGIDILTTANQMMENMQNNQKLSKSQVRAKRATTCRKSAPDSCADPFHQTTRSITGKCNNQQNPLIGSAGTPNRRLLGITSYSDGLSTMRTRGVNGNVLPSTRQITNTVFESGTRNASSRLYNHLLMQMGQFVAHDLVLMIESVADDGAALNCSECDSPTKVSINCAPIAVPENDVTFKTKCVRFTRALNGQTAFGLRQPINQNTHFLDLSLVYGSSDCDAEAVREYSRGRMLETQYSNYVLPPQNKNDKNCQSTDPKYCFKCGDLRASIQPVIASFHTIFIKQHNRLAQMIENVKSSLNDEQIFQIARKIMIAQWQHIIYSEYLPNILPFSIRNRNDLIPMGTGFFGNYDPAQDVSITNEFSGAAMRFGHSQIRERFQRLSSNNTYHGDFQIGNDIFYASQNYLDGIGGWEALIIGMMRSAMMEVDRFITYSVRNNIFAKRYQTGGGIDLTATNIQRGRDLGILPYTSYRKFVGLSEVKSFDDLKNEFSQENIDVLRSVYDSVFDIDLYPAILSERPVDGGLIGPTGSNIIAEVFRALKVGDRFFYENTGYLTSDQLTEIRKSTFSQIVCINMDTLNMTNTDIFYTVSQQVECTDLPDIDILKFI